MKNAQIVILTSDTDCDGTSFGAHRISVPAHRASEFLADPRAAAKHAVASEQGTSYGMDGAYAAMTVRQFRAGFWPNMDDFDRDYFNREGYTSGHERPHWNPWVEDDTIGIPALDTRYEDCA